MMRRDWARERVEKALTDLHIVCDVDSPLQETFVRLLKAERRRTLRMIAGLIKECTHPEHPQVKALQELRRRLQAGGRKG